MRQPRCIRYRVQLTENTLNSLEPQNHRVSAIADTCSLNTRVRIDAGEAGAVVAVVAHAHLFGLAADG